VPQFTDDDRQAINTENTLWNVVSLLDDLSPGAWKLRVDALRGMAVSIAEELRKYNDQFEEDE
jgi:hypothetical protein